MKLRKFFGLTSRAVLEQIRTELGPDAVIVANRPTADGIEITALGGDAMESILAANSARQGPAANADESRATSAASPAATLPSATLASAATPAKAAPGGVPAPSAAAAGLAWLAALPGMNQGRTERQEAESTTPSQRPDAPTPDPSESTPERREPLCDMAPAAATDALADRFSQELASMRSLIEEQLAQLAWTDTLRRSPLRGRLTRVLLEAGFSNALAREIMQRLPDDFSAQQAQDWVVNVLARNVRCAASEYDVVTRGGVYALVGPTGVGKTTTTAKLAARCAVRYGAGKLALLTTDSYRVGAHDQLRIYARILGVPVHTVSDHQDLRQALDSMRGKHLVLIDTVGMSQRDERVREQSMLLAQPEVQRMLLLNAAAQGETLEEVVAAYTRAPELGNATDMAGCVLTKVDEAGQLGQALDILIRHRLLLHYTSSGQRVPEDLHEPSATYLVHRSLRRGTKPTAFTLDDEAFSLIGGGAGVAHA